jgi:hypothetical protein
MYSDIESAIESAFLRGMRKCALEKNAFVGALAGTAIRTLAPFAASSLFQSKVLPKFMSRKGLIGTGATKLNNVLSSHGLKGTVAHMGLHTALEPVISKPVDYIANKFDGMSH